MPEVTMVLWPSLPFQYNTADIERQYSSSSVSEPEANPSNGSSYCGSLRNHAESISDSAKAQALSYCKWQRGFSH